MRTRLVLAVLPVTLLLLAGCEQLTATMQAAGMLVRTPAVGQDLDANLVQALPAELTAQGATLASVAVGEKDGITDTSPSPVSGAAVTLSFDGNSVTLCDAAEADAEGTYAATSVEGGLCGDSSLQYVSGTEYTFEIQTGGELYSLSVAAPEAVDSGSVTLSPALTAGGGLAGLLPSHNLNEALTLDWSGAGDAADHPAIVTVLRASYTGSTSNPTDPFQSSNWVADEEPVYDNMPSGVQDFLDLLGGDSNGSVQIPGSVFSSQGLYVVVVAPVVLSTDTSTNLALGSGTLAGAGTAFLFWVD